ncbi:hypothetical protein GGX14DRAFT_366613 [Mycena pura]|uniref:Secreted protein n=1 Tax=Mycena pura TaxID=153505 RepID=A0AAD6VAY0_9AGAR|nr:hypothetical protein GGX14DRAFT_366613 [Mycena pura]
MATSIWSLILVLALRVSLCCAALSLWPGGLGTRNPTAQQRKYAYYANADVASSRSPVAGRCSVLAEFDFDFTENESELASLLANHGLCLRATLGLDQLGRCAAALETYARRPDCFRRVAATIRARCGELEMHEDERVKAAISMTLCELATATHHSLPLECVSFTVDSDSDVSYAQMQQVPMQGDCVDALSRSAQFWSSYSGYLREVPQLCFAFRRWNDIDTAKEIYKNSTVETMALIRLMLAREKADLDGKKRWDAQILVSGLDHSAWPAVNEYKN